MSNQTHTCPRGHRYDATMDQCPYCPKPTGATSGTGGGPPPTRVHEPERGTKIMEVERKDPIFAWLAVMSGNDKGKSYRLEEGKNVVGRDADCDIVISDDWVGSRHATLNAVRKDEDLQFVLHDLDSKNGCFLNNAEEPVFHEELVDNDSIYFGETHCIFKCV